jgi:chemotaxis protein CheD
MVISDASEDVLIAYGLGSCVAVCLYDPLTRVGGMLHALLPTAPNENSANDKRTKFVDQGVPLLIKALTQSGARRTHLIAQLCGGAQVLSAPGLNSMLDIGERNVHAAETALQAAGLRIRGQATGGSIGRTVKFYIANGRVTTRSLGKTEHVVVES